MLVQLVLTSLHCNYLPFKKHALVILCSFRGGLKTSRVHVDICSHPAANPSIFTACSLLKLCRQAQPRSAHSQITQRFIRVQINMCCFKTLSLGIVCDPIFLVDTAIRCKNANGENSKL